MIRAAVLAVLLLLAAPAGAEPIDVSDYWPNRARMHDYYLDSGLLPWGFVSHNGDAIFSLTLVSGPSAFCLLDDYVWLLNPDAAGGGWLGLVRSGNACGPGPAQSRVFNPPLLTAPRFWDPGTVWQNRGTAAFLDTLGGEPVWGGKVTYESEARRDLLPTGESAYRLHVRVTTESDGQFFEETLWAVDRLPVCSQLGAWDKGIRRYRNSAGIDTYFTCWRRR